MRHFSLNQAYAISFLLLAMWAIFAFLTMHSQIEAQEQYAKLINISGKQRMLSQRTALLASQYIQTQDLEYLNTLTQFHSLMVEDHRYLLNNIPSQSLTAVYFQEPYLLADKAAKYFALLKDFIADSEGYTSSDVYLRATRLLPDLDHAVKVYEQESEYRTAQLMKIEGYILAGTLLTLVLEAVLILKPTLGKANLNMRQLEEMVQEKTAQLLQQKERQEVLIEDLEAEIKAREILEAERLDLEKQLRQKYKMEALGTLAGGISHNFNNSLAVIMGCLDLALTKQPKDEVIKLLLQAQSGVLRSRDLVKQLLAYSRKEEIEDKVINLSEVIGETVVMLKSSIPSSVVLHHNIDSSKSDVLIRGNLVQIQECLLNLSTNAVHAMEESGTLTILLEMVELTENDLVSQYQITPGMFAKLSVQDTGCGIGPLSQEKIFDLFFTTKELYEGTGMGLATVQSIVRHHGGQIVVHSEVGQGTTFILFFPLEVSYEVQKEVEHSLLSAPAKGIEHILLVDDDANLLSLEEAILTELGYQISAFESSSLALNEFNQNPGKFQLLVTDQTMPGLTGQQLIQEARKVRPELPVILCTGYSSLINKDQALAQGINAYIEKPVELATFSQIIRQCLDESKS